jgi:glycosyltransferase involved in cell wall biosynthesis
LHNCVFPAEAINKLPQHSADTFHINEFMANTPEVNQSCENADIILVERNLFGDTLTMMQYWKVRNKNIAVVFDDGYHVIDRSNMAFDFWGKGIQTHQNEKGELISQNIVPHPMEQFKWGLRIAKGIVTPSRVLSSDWDEYGKTYRTYNYLKLDRYDNKTPLFQHPKDEIFVGWSGSMSHYDSFTESGIAGALTFILKKYPQVKVLLTGDKRVYDRINIAENRKLFSDYVPEEKWSQLIASYDIGLCPLATDFDRKRSSIKALEYMIMKIPWIASDFETYEELHDYGTLTKNGLENWKTSLSYMIDNIEEKRTLANGKSYEFALSQSWDKNIHKLINIFEQIINSRYQ